MFAPQVRGFSMVVDTQMKSMMACSLLFEEILAIQIICLVSSGPRGRLPPLRLSSSSVEYSQIPSVRFDILRSNPARAFRPMLIPVWSASAETTFNLVFPFTVHAQFVLTAAKNGLKPR